MYVCEKYSNKSTLVHVDCGLITVVKGKPSIMRSSAGLAFLTWCKSKLGNHLCLSPGLLCKDGDNQECKEGGVVKGDW